MRWLESHWYRISPLALALYPISLVFRALVAVRRGLFRFNILHATRIGVPVIVVGNITVGGTGKTPLVMWLVDFLREQGFAVGVVSRGYGGTVYEPRAVTAESDPNLVGDETVLIAKRCHCPVWVGRHRNHTAQALLQAHPECNIVISDDGLQHYALARDVEIVVVDGNRGFGNAMMLPAGPLREPVNRLKTVDAIVVTHGKALSRFGNEFGMELTGEEFQNLLNHMVKISATELKNRRLVAVAGIGNPQRFFEHLIALGLTFTARSFPDHHRYSFVDLDFPDADAVLITEKDAVKCLSIANEKLWVLAVTAQVDRAFGNLILQKLGVSHGP